MASFEEIGNKYEVKLKEFTKFKIGKTGQTAMERYNEEYAETYTSVEVVGTSDNSSTIDNFEKYMINRFIKFPNCDNEIIGGGAMVESEEYLVYIVYNN